MQHPHVWVKLCTAWVRIFDMANSTSYTHITTQPHCSRYEVRITEYPPVSICLDMSKANDARYATQTSLTQSMKDTYMHTLHIYIVNFVTKYTCRHTLCHNIAGTYFLAALHTWLQNLDRIIQYSTHTCSTA